MTSASSTASSKLHGSCNSRKEKELSNPKNSGQTNPPCSESYDECRQCCSYQHE
ncbi:hypothetical protein JHK85_050480 [Glycine max]|nr:hypothetical protein JHK85_050480 [Glycine max]